jgi:hypothetical protein
VARTEIILPNMDAFATNRQGDINTVVYEKWDSMLLRYSVQLASRGHERSLWGPDQSTS